jgi:hypothetical protein
MRRKHYFDYSLNPYHPRSDVEEVLTLLRGRGGGER